MRKTDKRWIPRIASILLLFLGCGDINDDVAPTPTVAPTSTPDPNATPTATPACGGSGGLPGCRNFTWVAITNGNNASPSGFFASGESVGDVGNVGLFFGQDPQVSTSFFLRASAPDGQGVSQVLLVGPTQSSEDPTITLHAKLLLDSLCLRIFPETAAGELYCNGRTGDGVDTSLSAPAGNFPHDQPRDQELRTSLGAALLLSTRAGG